MITWVGRHMHAAAQWLRTRHPALRAAIILWLVFTAVVCVKAAVQPHKRTVYPYFSEAARHWWSNLDLYGTYPGFEPYRYSPSFAIAMTPLGLMPDAWGGLLWNIGNAALLVFAVVQAARHLFPLTYSEKTLGLLLLLTLAGSLRGLWSAQSNSLILSLVVLGMVAVLKNRWWHAAFWFALPVYIKLWPMLPALLVCVRWRRQLAVRFVAALGAVAFVPFLTRSYSVVLHQYARWYETLTGPLQQRWGGYRDLWTIWEELVSPVDYDLYLAAQFVGLAGLVAYAIAVHARRTPSAQYLSLMLAAWTGFQLLLGPATERLTYGLAALPMAWAAITAFQRQSARGLMVAAWLLAYLLGSGEVERALDKVIPFAPALAPLGILLFVGWIGWYHLAELRWPSAAAAGSQKRLAPASH